MQYKNFGRGSGLRVSELALGGGMFGERWGYGADLASSLEMFNMYAEQAVIFWTQPTLTSSASRKSG